MKPLYLMFAALAVAASPAFADPIGENMSYTLNKSRSHRFIKSGIVNHTVKSQTGDAYSTEMYCKFDVTFVGKKEGTGTMPFMNESFEPQWIETLRTGEVYVGPGYKVVHTGYGNARSAGGRVFENCDRLRIYDIDTSNACIQVLFQSLGNGPQQSVDNSVEMIAHVKSGYPILGFVQLDLILFNGNSRYDVGLDLKEQ